MKKLNNNNLDVYFYIKEFIKENEFAPSYRDILNGTNYKSPASVNEAIQKLIELGFLKASTDIRGNIISRSIKVIENENIDKMIKELRSEYAE